MAGITVREIGAKRLLQEIGVEVPITVTADPAFLLRPEPGGADILRANGISTDEPLVGFSVREQGAAAPDLSDAAYHRLLADTADFIIRRYGARVVFVPMEMADLQEAHMVVGQMTLAHRAHVLSTRYDPRQILGIMQHLELAVGMSLHFLIFAAVNGVPLARSEEHTSELQSLMRISYA